MTKEEVESDSSADKACIFIDFILLLMIHPTSAVLRNCYQLELRLCSGHDGVLTIVIVVLHNIFLCLYPLKFILTSINEISLLKYIKEKWKDTRLGL